MGRPDPQFHNNNDGPSSPGMVEMTTAAATTKTAVTYGEPAPVGQGDDSKKKWWWCCSNNCLNLSGVEYVYVGIMVVAVLAVVLAVSLVLALRPQEDEIQYNPRPTPIPTTTMAPESIQDSGSSPQRKAIQWLSRAYGESVLDNYEEWKKYQLLALATFFFASDGTRWQIPSTSSSTSWLDSTKSECDWYNSPYDEDEDSTYYGNYNFPICNGNGQVQVLRLNDLAGRGGGKHGPNNRLTPALIFPQELSLMAALKSIHLNHNNFVATFEKDLPIIDSLLDLSMKNNELYGGLPFSLGRLTNLQRLQLSHNKFHNHIPSQLGLMKSLQYLLLNDNYFRGTIASQFGLLTSLKVLDLSNNPLLRGSIPSQVLALPNLEVLNFANTRLTTS